MKQILHKLFFGKPEYNKVIRDSAYDAYAKNLARIWNNERHHDIGFEKILRLFLVSVQIFFPGIHVRALFRKVGVVKRNVAIEFFVLFKTCLPVFFLLSGLYKYKITVVISCYLLVRDYLLCGVAHLCGRCVCKAPFLSPQYPHALPELYGNIFLLRSYLCRLSFTGR